MNRAAFFDPDCRRCARLVAYLDRVRSEHPDYHCAPVAPFGDPHARLLVVGLAPGLHGANATGRPFTGDHAGILLYRTLYETGFADAPVSRHARDGLKLHRCRITNAVKCLPPRNRPTAEEVNRCNAFLHQELGALAPHSVVVALGRVAHQAVVRALGARQKAYPFAHGAEHRLAGLQLIDSYHCSRYNTQTGRLTPQMFLQIFLQARRNLEGDVGRAPPTE